MALGQMLNASVGQGAPCEQSVGGVVFTYVEIHIHTHINVYICTCLYVSNIKNTVHLVVLVYTLIWLNKTIVLQSTWNEGLSL